LKGEKTGALIRSATRSMALAGRVLVEDVTTAMRGMPFVVHGMMGFDNVSSQYGVHVDRQHRHHGERGHQRRRGEDVPLHRQLELCDQEGSSESGPYHAPDEPDDPAVSSCMARGEEGAKMKMIATTFSGT
jgi:hypothetical protein